MTVLLDTRPPRAAAQGHSASIAPRQMLTRAGLDWTQYVTITDALPDRPGLRTAYDGNTLELMTTSRRHKWWTELLGRLVQQVTLYLNVPLQSGGQTTFRDQALERGLEPDRCFWIQHADDLMGVVDWKAGENPPPDIAIEIDVMSSSVNRQQIYAQIGVPEIWRWNGRSLTALQLSDTREYEPIEFSVALPSLRVADLEPFLLRDTNVDETRLIREFIQWMKSQNFPTA